MKALFLASVAGVGLFGVSALASDLPVKAPVNRAPIAAPPYNWSGFYLGANFGGGLVGGGVEYGFKPNWTVKLEYDYLALSGWNSATVPVVALNRDVQMVKAGVNYKFESGTPAGPEASSAGGAGGNTEGLAKA